jgi:hypothetical protein
MLGLLVVLGVLGWCFDRPFREARRLRRSTDPEMLRRVCRELVKRTPGPTEGPSGNGSIWFVGADPSLPREILDLNASGVLVLRREVHIQFGGGFYGYGFVVLADTTTKSPTRATTFIPRR